MMIYRTTASVFVLLAINVTGCVGPVAPQLTDPIRSNAVHSSIVRADVHQNNGPIHFFPYPGMFDEGIDTADGPGIAIDLANKRVVPIEQAGPNMATCRLVRIRSFPNEYPVIDCVIKAPGQKAVLVYNQVNPNLASEFSDKQLRESLHKAGSSVGTAGAEGANQFIKKFIQTSDLKNRPPVDATPDWACFITKVGWDGFVIALTCEAIVKLPNLYWGCLLAGVGYAGYRVATECIK